MSNYATKNRWMKTAGLVVQRRIQISARALWTRRRTTTSRKPGVYHKWRTMRATTRRCVASGLDRGRGHRLMPRSLVPRLSSASQTPTYWECRRRRRRLSRPTCDVAPPTATRCAGFHPSAPTDSDSNRIWRHPQRDKLLPVADRTASGLMQGTNLAAVSPERPRRWLAPTRRLTRRYGAGTGSVNRPPYAACRQRRRSAAVDRKRPVR